MLSNLKKQIHQDEETGFVLQATLESLDTDVRDAFLDDEEDDNTIDMDEEDSSELAQLLDIIPEYDEEKEMSEKIKNLEESFLPEL